MIRSGDRIEFAPSGAECQDLILGNSVLERPIERLLEHPGSSLGAAFVAGMGTGALDDWSAIGRYARCDRIFEPDDSRTEAYRNAYGIYRDLYRRLETLYPSLADLPAA